MITHDHGRSASGLPTTANITHCDDRSAVPAQCTAQVRRPPMGHGGKQPGLESRSPGSYSASENFLYGFKPPGCAPLRRARFPALAAPALLPSARSALPPPTRAHVDRPRGMRREPIRRSKTCLRRGRSDSGMDGAPFASAADSWRALWAPIPSAFDPGRAEQSRPRASRSFVQWRAPP
jgi:hypothetical protein